MRKILGIAHYTFTEILRNRVWYVLVLFSGILLLTSVLIGDMAGELKIRIVTDFGIAAIEYIAFLSSLFAAVTLVVEEMESRTLYLILSRPVPRPVFILGRFLGLIAILTAAFVLMSALHALVLMALHGHIDRHYVLSLFFSWQKIVVITAAAFVFALFSTSTASAATFTFFFWIMGHFSTEILYLAKKTAAPLVFVICKFFYYIFPNFQTMNVRDIPPDLYSPAWLWSAGGYALVYTALCLGVAALLFQKKEF